MDNAHDKARLIFEDFSDRITYGHEDSDAALQNAIDWAFRADGVSEEFRADLYARVSEGWGASYVRDHFIVLEKVLQQVDNG